MESMVNTVSMAHMENMEIIDRFLSHGHATEYKTEAREFK